MEHKINGEVKNFLTRAGNANKDALSILLKCIEHMRPPSDGGHGDRTVLERLLSKAPRNMQPTMRLIAGRCLVNYTISTAAPKSETDRGVTLKPPSKKSGKNAGFDDVQIAKLRKLVDDKVSIASAVVREQFKGESTPKPKKDDEVLLAKKADDVIAWLVANNLSSGEFIQRLQKKAVAVPVQGEPAH